jgi:hypothetical protein
VRMCVCVTWRVRRAEVVAREAQLRKFFQNVDAAIREAGEITETSTAYEVSLGVGLLRVCVCVCVSLG